jgi:ATP-dependent Clp protease adaptor protein ClpS
LSKKENAVMIKVKKIVKAIDFNSENGNEFSLILFNDDFNTFDFVVNTLMDVCDHNEEQAYQCTLIAHHKGKCEVRKGLKNDLKNRCSELIKKGLSAEIYSKV